MTGSDEASYSPILRIHRFLLATHQEVATDFLTFPIVPEGEDFIWYQVI